MGIPYATWRRLVERVHPDAAALHPAAPRRGGKPSSRLDAKRPTAPNAKGRYSFTIHDWHPTRLNQLLGCHWGTVASRKALDRSVIALKAELARIPRASGPRRVRLVITLGKGQRGGDPDAYWKSALDALVHCGLLIDDNRQHVELAPVEFARAKEPSTTIELEDL